MGQADANEGCADVTAIILSFNEEANISQCLESVVGWARSVYVLDSYSTDGTVGLARSLGAHVWQHPFVDFSSQRNFALRELPIGTEWSIFLDADEWLSTDLREEISALILSGPPENGFYMKRRLIWMGRWIQRGYYPVWILRLFRTGFARCESREVNEHLLVEGATGRLTKDLIHEDHKGVGEWIAKHNAYATREARLLLRNGEAAHADTTPARLFGLQHERVRWLRDRLWHSFPPLLRPFGFFFYRYVLRGGFLDGKEAFIYHFLQALWFPFLVDVKYLESRARLTGVVSRSGRRY